MSLSPADIQALLQKTQTPQRRPGLSELLHKHNYDRAALFLLTLHWENMFEAWISTYQLADAAQWFRCKGCGAKVKRLGRESHYTWHKRDLHDFSGSST